MITFFKRVLKFIVAESDQSARDKSPAAEADRRAACRFRFGGFEIGVRGGNASSTMQLKDLSCTGGAGITDLAVPVGGTIILRLADGEARAAQVRWVRNWTMGFHFIEPLEDELVVQLCIRRWCSSSAPWIEPSQFGEAREQSNTRHTEGMYGMVAPVVLDGPINGDEFEAQSARSTWPNYTPATEFAPTAPA